MEVAREVGLGRTTVSDILNRGDAVADRYNQATRRRVADAVRKLGYAPSRAAQSLAKGRSGQVGLILTRDFSNPYFARLADAIERELRDHGLRLQIAITAGDEDLEKRRIREMQSEEVEGLLIGPVYEALDVEPIHAAFGGRMPLVCLGGHFDPVGFDLIGVDSGQGYRLLVEHLIAMGHRRVGFVGAPRSRIDPSSTTHHRAVEAVRDAGVLLPEWITWHADTGRFADYARMSTAFVARWKSASAQTRPTAVLCHNDQAALTLLHALHEAGVSVPGDLSVTGHDNLPESGYLVPSLTTIDNHVDRQMKAAVEQLLDRISDPSVPARVRMVGPELIQRGSVRAIDSSNSPIRPASM